MALRLRSVPLGSEAGSALIISLLFLLLLTIIGVAAMQSATLQERMAGNTRDRNLAFQATETALRAGEQVLRQAVVPTFNNSVAGYRQPVTDSGSLDYWTTTYNWSGGAGTHSGSRSYTGSLGGVAEVPRFVIEELSVTDADVANQSPEAGVQVVDTDSSYYRITARGVGSTPDTVVILQTVFKR